jgi:hypothetical protein
VCDVTHDNGKAGYVLLFESPEGLMPVMYSASEFPSSLIGQVASPARPVTDGVSPHVQSLPDVTMVGIPKMQSERAPVTSLACCVASISMWVQQRYRIPLLSLPEEVVISTTRPFEDTSPLLRQSPPPSAGELSSFYEQKSKIYEDPTLWEPIPARSDSQPSSAPPPGDSRRSKDSTILFERMRPILHSELMKDLSRAARWELIDRYEFPLAADTLAKPFSAEAGMVSAIVIQSYLTSAPNPEQGLEDFARSRGLRSAWFYSPAGELTAQKVPCVLLGPQNQAVLVTGLSDKSDVKWVYVIAPETVRPVELSRKELAVERLAKAKANDPSLPSSLRSPQAVQRLEDSIQKGKARWLQGTVVYEPKTGTPLVLEQGAHVARLDLFDGWKVLSINVTGGH